MPTKKNFLGAQQNYNKNTGEYESALVDKNGQVVTDADGDGISHESRKKDFNTSFKELKSHALKAVESDEESEKFDEMMAEMFDSIPFKNEKQKADWMDYASKATPEELVNYTEKLLGMNDNNAKKEQDFNDPSEAAGNQAQEMDFDEDYERSYGPNALPLRKKWEKYQELVSGDQDDETIAEENSLLENIAEEMPFKDDEEREKWEDMLSSYRGEPEFDKMTEEILARKESNANKSNGFENWTDKETGHTYKKLEDSHVKELLNKYNGDEDAVLDELRKTDWGMSNSDLQSVVEAANLGGGNPIQKSRDSLDDQYKKLMDSGLTQEEAEDELTNIYGYSPDEVEESYDRIRYSKQHKDWAGNEYEDEEDSNKKPLDISSSPNDAGGIGQYNLNAMTKQDMEKMAESNGMSFYALWGDKYENYLLDNGLDNDVETMKEFYNNYLAENKKRHQEHDFNNPAEAKGNLKQEKEFNAGAPKYNGNWENWATKMDDHVPKEWETDGFDGNTRIYTLPDGSSMWVRTDNSATLMKKDQYGKYNPFHFGTIDEAIASTKQTAQELKTGDTAYFNGKKVTIETSGKKDTELGGIQVRARDENGIVYELSSKQLDKQPAQAGGNKLPDKTKNPFTNKTEFKTIDETMWNGDTIEIQKSDDGQYQILIEGNPLHEEGFGSYQEAISSLNQYKKQNG